MTAARIAEDMSPKLLEVAERARRKPSGKFYSLAHLIDLDALERAYQRQRADAAVGVDGVSKERYGENLLGNLQDLHQRMRAKRYRHQPIRRVHIPKPQSTKTRPIGISCFEDKLVQDALREVLEAVYEQDFLDCSYGFRPGRGAHDAVRKLNEVVGKGEANWILEADVESYFDSVDRRALKEMLQERIPDGSLLRLIGKCMHVGILDGEEFTTPERGTTQGSVLSPLLGNLYLHHVLDRWFEETVKPRLQGRGHLIRYADDFVMLFELEADARRVREVLGKRLAKYQLTLSEEKTRLVPFRKPDRRLKGKGPGTFDFLGFTFYWRRSRKDGLWRVACKTRAARLYRSIGNVYRWCRQVRHLPMADQHAGLSRRLRGHFNYFGVNGNTRCLRTLYYQSVKAWYKWLRRRSQKTRLTWPRFNAYLQTHPLPQPRVYVQIWAPRYSR